MNSRFLTFVVMLCALALAACGGGGGGSGGGKQDDDTTSPPPPPQAPPFTLLSSERGSAYIEERQGPAIAFMGNGDGVAVWVADTGTRDVLMMSSYTAATDSWAADQELAVGDSRSVSGIAAAAGDAAIGVVYSMADEIYGTVYANGQFSAPQTLDTALDDLWVREATIVSSGDGFAAVWTRAESRDPMTYDTVHSRRTA